MIRITVDDETKAKLHNLTIPLDLCDEDGFVLGRLEPVTSEETADKREIDVAKKADNDQQHFPVDAEHGL